jgi:lipopolysaccharide biosynthesis glycosyltransferase
MLHSLQQRLAGGHRVVLHLSHEDLGEAEFAAIGVLVDEVRDLRVDHEIAKCIPASPRYPLVVASHLLLHRRLGPDVDKVIFFDADLLVRDDVSRLLETDLEGCFYAAARDEAIPTKSSPRGLERYGTPDDSAYCNCGVFVFEPETWRREEFGERVITLMRRPDVSFDFYHQGAMNAVAGNRVKLLEGRWNRIASHLLFGRTGREASIVHFAGAFKPWLIPLPGELGAEYLRALREVAHLYPQPSPTARLKLLDFYQKTLRGTVFPLENLLWQKRIL